MLCFASSLSVVYFANPNNTTTHPSSTSQEFWSSSAGADQHRIRFHHPSTLLCLALSQITTQPLVFAHSSHEQYVFRPAFSTQTTRARANVTAAGFHDTHRCDVQKQHCILPFSPVCSSDTTSSLYSTSLPLPCSPDNRSPRSSTFETFTSDPALIIAAHHTTAPSLLHSVSTAPSPLFASIPWVLVLKLGIAMATDLSGAVDPETLYTKQQCIGKGIYTAETRQGADSLF